MHSLSYSKFTRDFERLSWLPAGAARPLAAFATGSQWLVLTAFPSVALFPMLLVLGPGAAPLPQWATLLAGFTALAILVVMLLATITFLVGFFQQRTVEGLLFSFGCGFCFTLGVLLLAAWDLRSRVPGS